MSPLWVVRIALRSLAAHGLRTFLTMLGIIIGVGCVIAMLSMGAGASNALRDEIQKLGANLVFIRPGAARQGHVQTGQVDTLKLDDAHAIAAEVPGVLDLAPESSTMKQVKYLSKNQAATVFGTTPSYADIRNCAAAAGRWFTWQEARLGAKVCLLGAALAEELFGAGSPLGASVKVGGVNYEVIGVLEAKGESCARARSRPGAGTGSRAARARGRTRSVSRRSTLRAGAARRRARARPRSIRSARQPARPPAGPRSRSRPGPRPPRP
jgi:putative ABC transport system permease protein